MFPELVNKIVKYTKDNFKITLRGTTKLQIGSTNTQSTVKKLFTPTYKFQGTELEEILGTPPEMLDIYFNQVFDALLTELLDLKDEEASKKLLKLNPNLGTSEPFDICKYQPAIDLVTAKSYVLTPEYRLSGIEPKTLKDILPTKQWDEWRTSSELIHTVYNPQSLKHITCRDVTDPKSLFNQPYSEVNICNHAPWRYLPLTETKLHPLLEKQFNYFIPDQECRHYFFCWLKTAVFSKNGTCLVLIGTKGSGKGLLARLMRKVVGAVNYTEAHRSFLTSGFNKVLMNKMLILVDELKADKKGVEVLKSYLNDQQNIEEKGKDADTLHDMHASFILTNNNKTAMHIMQDDRRFSIMDLPEKDMPTHFEGTEWVDKINNFVDNDPDVAHGFGSFLYNYDDKGFNKYKPFKGKTFHQVVLLSFNPWQQLLYDLLTEQGQCRYDYKDVFSDEGSSKSPMYKRPRTLQMVHDFITSYKYEGEELAKLERDEKDAKKIWIIPCKALMPSEMSESPSNLK